VKITNEYFFPEVSARLATACQARSDVYAKFCHNTVLSHSSYCSSKPEGSFIFSDLV